MKNKKRKYKTKMFIQDKMKFIMINKKMIALLKIIKRT